MRLSFAALLLAAATIAAAPAAAADRVKVEGKVFPESFAATADGTLYIGSITTGQIFRAAPGTDTATPFIAAPTDGPTAGLGVYADARTGQLWACYADLAAFAGQKGAPSMLRLYDLASGAEKAHYALPETSFCNDITTAPDGTAYVADTSGSRVLRLKPGAGALEAWLTDPALAGVDGITMSPKGALFANSVSSGKLFRIDIGADGAGRITPLATSAPLKGPDGMRFGADGVLYLAENAAGQVDSVSLDGDTATVTPLLTGLDTPTAVDKPGDQLWALEARLGQMQDPNATGPFYVVPVP